MRKVRCAALAVICCGRPVFAAGDQAQALIEKNNGDAFAAKDDLKDAADPYIKALALGRFPIEVRLKLAESVSWAGRYPEAAAAFRAILFDDPGNIKARVDLAKTLSWMDDRTGALAEIENVLRREPGDRAALLVKANTLRSMGENKKAIGIYNKILEGGDDFDTRTGLAYALLAEGDRKAAAACAGSLRDSQPGDDYDARTGGDYALLSRGGGGAARACAASLKAQYPYQEAERKELVAELASDIKPSVEAPDADDVEALKKKLGASADKAERAALDKRIGDAYVAKDDFGRAAGYYIEALSLGTFSAEDRLALATRISWGDRLAAAAKEFRALTTEDPANLKAGTALAKTLSWMGDNAGALTEIERVLGRAPDDRDALLVEANALRLTGRLKEAISIYNRLLQAGDNFDARAGLAYALLAQGDRKAAVASAAPLKAQYPYQAHELVELNAELAAAVRPTISAGFSYYNDTDSNNVERYALGSSQWIGSVKTDLDFIQVDAKDSTARSSRADILSFEAYRKLTGTLGVGGGLALDAVKNGATSDFVTWNVKADKKISGGALGASAVSYLMTDTAQLISNDIRATSYGLSAFKGLTARVLLNGSYSYKDYSDNNGSNDAQISPSYLLLLQNPRLAVGYKLRYLGFRRQSGSGYYDPSSNIAQLLFTNVSFDRGYFYGYAEPYGGHQTERRNRITSNSYFAGGSGSLGYKPFKSLSAEATAEGGNYSVQSAAGWEYYQLGLRVVYIP